MTDWESLESILGRFQQVDDEQAGALERPGDAKSRLEKIAEDDAEETLKLKKLLAKGSFVVVGIQLLIADFAFFSYGRAKDWTIDREVMVAWLAATVIEVLGVIIIIAKHLFPPPK